MKIVETFKLWLTFDYKDQKKCNWIVCFMFARKVLSLRNCAASPCLCGRTTGEFRITTGNTRSLWCTACTSFCRKPLESSLNWRSVCRGITIKILGKLGCLKSVKCNACTNLYELSNSNLEVLCISHRYLSTKT